MPQLATETIVTQYFWLIVILFGFYYIAVTKVIPHIANAFKIRRVLETQGIGASANSSTISSSGLSLLTDPARSFLSQVLNSTPKLNIPTINYFSNFEKACSTWTPNNK